MLTLLSLLRLGSCRERGMYLTALVKHKYLPNVTAQPRLFLFAIFIYNLLLRLFIIVEMEKLACSLAELGRVSWFNQ